MVKVIFKPQLFLNHVFSAVLLELTLLVEFVKFVTSNVLLALVQLQTVFPALLVKSFTVEDVGLNALLFLFKKWVKVHHALILVLMDFTKYLKLNVLLVPSNVQLAQDQLEIALLVFMDQSQSTDHVPFNVEKTNSASEDSVLLAQKVVMDAKIVLKVVLTVQVVMLELDLSVKKDVFLINSLKIIKKDVLLVDLNVLHAQLSIIVLPARTQPSTQEEESALPAPIHAELVMEVELAHHASVDSSTSKEHAGPLVLMELLLSMEFVNANQELFLLANV